MAVPTATDILTIIESGTYNVDWDYFDIEQLEKRRRYPSIEVFLVNPASHELDKKVSSLRYTFKVRVFQKLLGVDTSDEINVDQSDTEDEIKTLFEAASLGDHKIIKESLVWSRDQQRVYHPYYVISTLDLVVSGLTTPILPTDGFLIFNTSTSTVKTAPGSNYTYSPVFDTEIMEQYRTHEEQVTVSPISPGVPIRYRGGYTGRFITHMSVKSADFGTTGDKVNQLQTLLSNGEKPTIGFTFSDKTTDSPTTHQIQEALSVDIDRIERAYNYNDLTIYRIYGFLTKPSTVTVT